MATAILTALALLALVSAFACARTVRQDGLGHRTPPASHLTWDVGTRSGRR